jgi:phage shock protein PspC (stress-responsive transcriptional regulator)
MTASIHPSQSSPRLLARRPNGILAGVCEGIGHHTGISPTLLRLAWVASVLFFGTGILLYILLWWLMPRAESLPYEPAVWVRGPNGSHPPLQRTVHDRKIFGVVGGLARRWDIDPTLLRLGALALFMVSGPLAIGAYLIAALVMPSAERPFQATPHPVEL